MPTAPEILAGLNAIANQARAAGIGWHVALGLLIVSLLIGWRPTRRRLGFLLTLPLFSVAVLAAAYRNPFNFALPALAGTTLAWLARRLPNAPVHLDRTGWGAIGVLLFAYGWVYPHFLETESALSYLYAAPTGLVPCPSLAVAIGLALLVGGLSSPAWSWVLAGIGLFYGLFGMLRLGVLLDVGLVLGAAVLAARGFASPLAGSQPRGT